MQIRNVIADLHTFSPSVTILPGIVLCTAPTSFPLSAAARAFPISAL